jgi:hypothetical protein
MPDFMRSDLVVLGTGDRIRNYQRGLFDTIQLLEGVTLLSQFLRLGPSIRKRIRNDDQLD